MQDAGEVVCRSYRFGHVMVDVFAELVAIVVPYCNPSHEDFVEASMFVERYTHGVDAMVLESDELSLELHIYPNTEILVGSRPHLVPSVDPRIGLYDPPRQRSRGVLVREVDRRPALAKLYCAATWTEQYLQEIAVRAGAAGFALAQAATSH